MSYRKFLFRDVLGVALLCIAAYCVLIADRFFFPN